MKLNWNFLGGVGVQNKKPSVGGVWTFPGTTRCELLKNRRRKKNKLERVLKALMH